MSIDPTLFRAALGRFASGVTVVSVQDAEGLAAITVSAFCSVSMEPPLVLVSIGQRSRAHPRIASAGRFGVSVLADVQQELSDRFAGRPDVAGVPEWEVDGWESPVLKGALARLDCRVEQAVSAGDHTLFLGRVVRADVHEGEPLAYWRGAYRGVVAR
jgi:flavin reductase (DIM6/NTAB) family NADH-FMN oxidoreductase RutF